MFDTVEDTISLLESQNYIADIGLATGLFLALKMEKAIFLEGEPDVGKTEIAKVLSVAIQTPLIRLQCYEGLDINVEWADEIAMSIIGDFSSRLNERHI